MISFVFSGQGSQYVGMASKIPVSSVKKELFTKASDFLGFDLEHLCNNGPIEELTSTDIAQPALVTVSAIYDTLLKERNILPGVVAGHSLGEFSALFSAEVLSFEDSLFLVRERGLLMKKASEKAPGKMLAVIGLPDEKLKKVLEESSDKGVIVAANFNSPGQVVLSGADNAIEKAKIVAKENGAKIVKVLNVSAPFHSPLMEPVVPEMSKFIDSVQFNKPAIPVVQNATGKVVSVVEEIKENLKKQLTSPVLWTDSVNTMSEMGVEKFIEVGPKNVLKGLIRRTLSECEIETVEVLLNA
ncbi:MAG: [acyl-carrier-protein] S-malonyltransferase [Caldiserica bacterium]|nr:MAG: [acyl-carrier-protein] S-malonyltransferase [Caldisericota bacterium]